MKLDIRHCPKCEKRTLQAQTRIPKWKYGKKESDSFDTVWFCSQCSSYIKAKTFDTYVFPQNNYDLE